MKKFLSTTKASSRQISRNKRLKQTVWFGGGILLVLFVVPQILALVAYVAFTPVIALQSYFRESTATIPSYFRDRNSLITIQEDLRRQIETQKASEFTIDKLTTENRLLKGLGAMEDTRIIAGVSGRPTELPYDVLVIDKGSGSGIMENAPVYSGQDQALGYIAAVYPNSSLVVLATTPEFKSTVYIYGPNVYATAVGQGSGGLKISIPQGIKVSVGDMVIMPAFDSAIYGEISSVDSSPTKPEQFAFVSTGISLQSLRYVSVDKEPIKSVEFKEAKDRVDAIVKDLLSFPVPNLVNGSSSASSTNNASSTI